MINFTLLARRWPRLMTCWESVEGRLPVYADARRNWFCHRQIKRYTIWITFIIFGMCTVYGVGGWIGGGVVFCVCLFRIRRTNPNRLRVRSAYISLLGGICVNMLLWV